MYLDAGYRPVLGPNRVFKQAVVFSAILGIHIGMAFFLKPNPVASLQRRSSPLTWLNIPVSEQQSAVPNAKQVVKRSNIKHPTSMAPPTAIPVGIASSITKDTTKMESAPKINWSNAARAAIKDRTANTEPRPRQFGERSSDKSPSIPPESNSSKHLPGDQERFDDGEAHTWVNSNCYLTTNNGQHFREFTLGIPDRSGSKLTCVEPKQSMPSGPHMFEGLKPKQMVADDSATDLR